MTLCVAAVLIDMSQKDVSEQLINMNRPVNQRNVEILARMIEYRLEVTPETFDMIENLTKKKQKANVIESTVVAHSKGLGDLKKSVDVLMRFFANQNKSGVNSELLVGQLNKMQALLGKGQELFDKGMLQGVIGLIEDIRKDAKNRA